MFAFIDLLFGENSRTGSSYIIIILASMNSWNSANLHFEPAIRYYVARRVFHVVYISIVFRWLFKVNRNTPRGGDTRVKQAKEGRVTTSGVPNRRRTLPSRLEPYSSHLEWRVFYLRKEEIFLPFFSLSLSLFFFFSRANRFHRGRSPLLASKTRGNEEEEKERRDRNL